MQDQNIVMFCQQNWDLGIGTSARSLAKEFAKQNRVLYVNMPLDFNGLLRRFRQPEVRTRLRVMLGLTPGLEQVEPNVWVYTPDVINLSINWLTSSKLFTVLNRFNALLLARSIRRAVAQVGFDSFFLLQDGLIFQGAELKRLLQPRQFIYYLRDNMVTVPYFQRHGPRLERSILEQADVVATNSVYINDYTLQYNAHSYIIGQGCTLADSLPTTPLGLPADMANIPAGHRIGYTGVLTALRLDIDLLLAIARRRPDWHLVLVGPEDEAFRTSALHQQSNVYFLGSKLPHQLPAYLTHFDVCINPQVVNGMTIGNYPLKIDEYLTLGKPVVATNTRAMALFAPYVYLARHEAEWMEMLTLALREKDPAQQAARIGFARSHTWEACANIIYGALTRQAE